ncbi:MAG: Gfo/Idh/MocA family oxidoreductase [Anaerolineae bacterium]|nr:Gfo/Idh/MocA family oxidoreductase [Anaerolineae bacterium]
MREYRVGIIGFGFIGKVHVYGHLNLPLFYDPVPCKTVITHICTSHQETAEKGRTQIGAQVATTDFRAITENPDMDIVHICTPNNLHKAQLLSAMRHNKHIYCDKPLVVDMAEAHEIERALQDYRGIAQMTFQNRFFPATIRARQLVEEGFLGQILEFRACYLHSGSANPDAPLKWKLSAQSGGGVIADLGSHVMDLMHYLLGDFAELLAMTHIAYPERLSPHDPQTRVPVDAEDCVRLLLRTRTGAVGTIEASKIATGTEDELRFEIHGAAGALRFNSMTPHYLEAYDAGLPDRPVGGRRGWTRIDCGQRYPEPAGFPGPKFTVGWIRTHMACLAHFLQNVASGVPGEPGLAQGLYVQKLIECARTSAQNRCWVQV